jgi:hypothetical protein
MLLGKMTASTWTRVVDKVKEGHNLREPVPPRHSPGTEVCPFKFTVKWDLYGFYVTVEKKGFGCPNHENHIKGDLSKCSLPIQLIPDKEKEIL